MRILFVLVSIALSFSMAMPAQSQSRRVAIVRDAEIERLVSDYARPLLQAAGLQRSGIEIVLINDRSFNAFVSGRRIFVHTGALLTTTTPNEIIGVLAHEIAHLAGGHQHRLREQLERAQTLAIVSMVVGVGAGVAGSLSESGRGLGAAGPGMALGGAEVARRFLLSYQRGEEATADRAAVDYLNATKQSSRGMLTTFSRMGRDLALTGMQVDPYQVSHPLPRERLSNLEEQVRKSPYADVKDSAALQLRHDLMRAKLVAYTGESGAASRMLRGAPPLALGYADTISTYLRGSPRDALAKADNLLKTQPNNPYFHEIRGEILMKANRPADAASAYARAMKAAAGSPAMLQAQYGIALLASGKPAEIRQAATELRAALTRAPDYAAGYRYLSQAEGRLGNIGAAELAAAEEAYHTGQYRDSKVFALRAQQKLKPRSPEWLRAQDIIQFKEPRG